MRRTIPLGFVLPALAIGLAAGFLLHPPITSALRSYRAMQADRRDMERRLVGAPVPALPILDYQMEHRLLDSVTGGDPALIYFWSSRCRYCENLLEDLPVIAERFPEVELIGIATDRDPRIAACYLAVNEFDHPDQYYLSPEQRDSSVEDYSLYIIPTIWAVDIHGVVRNVHRGYRAPAALHGLVEELSASP